MRAILNFGHTIGHALEAETKYERFRHGEAVAFGMIAATRLAVMMVGLPAAEAERIVHVVNSYGPIPDCAGITAASLVARLGSDKKTMQGRVHFVLPTAIGAVKIVSGIGEDRVLEAIAQTLQVPA